MNKEEITKILNKFDKVLENYELDKKFGQLSVDSIYSLFPTEMIVIKDYIEYLEQALLDIKEYIENYEIIDQVDYDIRATLEDVILGIVNKAIGSEVILTQN